MTAKLAKVKRETKTFCKLPATTTIERYTLF